MWKERIQYQTYLYRDTSADLKKKAFEYPLVYGKKTHPPLLSGSSAGCWLSSRNSSNKLVPRVSLPSAKPAGSCREGYAGYPRRSSLTVYAYSGTPPYDHPVYKTTSLLRPYSFKPNVITIESFYNFEDPVNATTSLLRPGFYGPTVVALTGFHCTKSLVIWVFPSHITLVF